MVIFNTKEKTFLVNREACRVATCHNDVPHVVPVSYLLDGGSIYFATDYGTKKLNNLLLNPNIAVVVDEYASIGNAAVSIQGKAVIIHRGALFRRLYKKFYKRFSWVRENPWEEGEAPFVKVVMLRKISWGLS